MNTLPHLLASLPDCYQDGSFQVLMRDAESVAVFWDLPDDSPSYGSDVRLCLHIVPVNGVDGMVGQAENLCGAREVLILHHEAGHALVPLTGGHARYRFALGWDDGTDFRQIAVDEVEMPLVGAPQGRPVMKKALEGRGFRPLAMAT